MRHALVSTLTLGALAVTLSVPALAGDRTGRQVYECTCIACHGSGWIKAPKMGDAKAWHELVEEGLDDLIPASLAGLRLMPPKGGNPLLSDLEVARAVVYMANENGGSFAEPTVDDLPRWREMAEERRRKAKKAHD